MNKSVDKEKIIEKDEAAFREVIKAWEKVGVKVYAYSGRKICTK